MYSRDREIINNKREIKDVNSKNDDIKQNPLSDTASGILLVDKRILKKNSIFLKELQEQISKNYTDLEIDSKFTISENKILAGITGSEEIYLTGIFFLIIKKR